MQKLIVAALAALAFPAVATSIEATVAPGTTQCGWYLDGAATPTLTALWTPTTCRLVLSSTLAAGDHTVSADARAPADAMWSSVMTISPRSSVFTFTKPNATGGTAPTDLKLVP